MTTDETSRPVANLTDPTGVQESGKGSTEPQGDTEEGLTEESKAGFQKALQKSQENLKGARSKMEELERKLKTHEREQKKASLAEMSELERYKALFEDEAEKNAKLRIKLLADRVLAGKKLPPGIARIVRETPWTLPDIADELGNKQADWEEVLDLVEEKLPTIVDTLVIGSQESQEEQPRRVDPERSAVTAAEVQKTRRYTRAEIDAIAKDPEMFKKHQPAILKQLEQDKSVVL